MKVLLRVLRTLVVLVLVLAVVGGGWFYWRANAGMPALDGRVSHPSLTGEVTLKRDNWGVPHIYADNEVDAYFALGYAQAQDRLFQMEIVRRLAQGKLSELFGPIMVPRIDAIARSFRLLPKAQEYADRYKSTNPEITALSEAYCAGVNHFVETGPLPVEFALLAIPKHTYTPADCMSVAAILPIAFADGLREDVLQSLLKERFPEMDTTAFFPGEAQDPAPVTVMETIDEALAILRAKAAATPAPAATEAPTVVSALAPLVDSLSMLANRFGHGLGSNSWVVSGALSASGKPLLANDPHIPFSNPSVWYEAQIQCPELDLYGYYLPLIPITLLGHNDRFGWTITMLANDDVDLFEETFDPANPGRVKYKGEWVDVKSEEQTIGVRFGKDVKANIRVTNHGPVITDLLRLMLDYKGPDVSMSWVWQHLEYTDLLGFYKMARAKNIADFQSGVALITSPGLNISYADSDNNIGWWGAGRLPIRRPGLNPKTLLDGASGNDEVLGYLPFESNPQLVNPPQGYIVTANNWSTVKPLGPNGEINPMPGYFQPLDRAGRLEQVLSSKATWTLEEMKQLQYDDEAYTGDEMRGVLLSALDGAELSPAEKQAADLLRAWDLRHDIDSVGATIYWVAYEYIMEQWAGDEFGEKQLPIYDSLADSFNGFKLAMRRPELPGWDNVNTPEKETQQDILLAAWKEAVAVLAKNYGSDPTGWTWGKAHTMEFSHPLGYLPGLNKVFNIGPFPSTGSQQVVNNMLFSANKGKYAVLAGPSTRRVVDFATPDDSYSILPTGNSGHFLSPHYDDQAELFMTGKWRKLNFTKEQVDANTEHTLTFGK